MSGIELQEVVGRSAWLGQDIQSGEDWIYRLSDEEIGELDAALRHLQSTGRQIPDAGKEHFPLKRFARTLRLLQTEVEDGLGMLPANRFQCPQAA